MTALINLIKAMGLEGALELICAAAFIYGLFSLLTLACVSIHGVAACQQ
mgnify:CR=1 FL=1